MSKDLTKDLGTIVLWRKTYGFLKADGHSGNDIFFHGGEFKSPGEPEVGQRCAYFLAPSKRNRSQIVAVDVTAL